MTAVSTTLRVQPGNRNEFPWQEPLPLSLRLAKGVVLVIVMVVVVVPFLSVLATSLAADQYIIRSRGCVRFPETPRRHACATLLRDGVVARALAVSIGVPLVGPWASLAMTGLMAYGLARRGPRTRVVVYLVLFTMLFTPG